MAARGHFFIAGGAITKRELLLLLLFRRQTRARSLARSANEGLASNFERFLTFYCRMDFAAGGNAFDEILLSPSFRFHFGSRTKAPLFPSFLPSMQQGSFAFSGRKGMRRLRYDEYIVNPCHREARSGKKWRLWWKGREETFPERQGGCNVGRKKEGSIPKFMDLWRRRIAKEELPGKYSHGLSCRVVTESSTTGSFSPASIPNMKITATGVFGIRNTF